MGLNNVCAYTKHFGFVNFAFVFSEFVENVGRKSGRGHGSGDLRSIQLWSNHPSSHFRVLLIPIVGKSLIICFVVITVRCRETYLHQKPELSNYSMYIFLLRCDKWLLDMGNAFEMMWFLWKFFGNHESVLQVQNRPNVLCAFHNLRPTFPFFHVRRSIGTL